jgi:mono/diheme cytochrome c family protein
MPRSLLLLGIPLGLLALVPFLLIARSRERTSAIPRVAIVQDMGHQPKFTPQAESPLFADGRAARPAVDGTIAQGEWGDERITQGKEKGAFLKRVPLPITKERLLRGQQRFDIYCAPCHGLSGYGNGMVAVRAAELAEQQQARWVTPVSYHTDAIRAKEDGYFFNTITYGVRTMPPYGSQIPIEDRWAIVMYLRALQRSQWTRMEDVPLEKREDLR